MKSVTNDVYTAAHRFGIVTDAGGRKVRPIAPPDLDGFETCGGEGGRLVAEFAAGGEVIARRVETSTGAEYWLRADLVALAETALQYEAKEHARIIETVGAFIADTDAAGAERHGITIEEYRRKRHNAGNRWERYRAANRAGGF
jgi:hypothetical protein